MGRTAYDPVRAKAVRKRTLTAAVLIFAVIPLCILLGIVWGENRHYMLVSLAVAACTLIPFFLVFERRKPKAREIVLLAMMTAITVAAHILLHITVPLQIGTAMVIAAGAALGPEAGFLVGALSRLLCNFYMGQGPWTPWQMFCWGLLGFLAGLSFNKADLARATDQKKSDRFQVLLGPVVCVAAAEVLAYVSWLLWPGADGGAFGSWRVYVFGFFGLVLGVLLQHKRMPVDGVTLAAFTFFSTVILYGGLMNLAALFTTAALPGGAPGQSGDISLHTLRLLYISGLPYDLAHGAAAAFCSFLMGEPLIRKLERIKIKYGIYK